MWRRFVGGDTWGLSVSVPIFHHSKQQTWNPWIFFTIRLFFRKITAFPLLFLVDRKVVELYFNRYFCLGSIENSEGHSTAHINNKVREMSRKNVSGLGASRNKPGSSLQNKSALNNVYLKDTNVFKRWVYDVCIYTSVLLIVQTHFPGSFRLKFVECELLKAI